MREFFIYTVIRAAHYGNLLCKVSWENLTESNGVEMCAGGGLCAFAIDMCFTDMCRATSGLRTRCRSMPKLMASLLPKSLISLRSRRLCSSVSISENSWINTNMTLCYLNSSMHMHGQTHLFGQGKRSALNKANTVFDWSASWNTRWNTTENVNRWQRFFGHLLSTISMLIMK